MSLIVGAFDGLCNRTACRVPGATWWNTSTRKYYCRDCARRINKHAPGLCVDDAERTKDDENA